MSGGPVIFELQGGKSSAKVLYQGYTTFSESPRKERVQRAAATISIVSGNFLLAVCLPCNRVGQRRCPSAANIITRLSRLHTRRCNIAFEVRPGLPLAPTDTRGLTLTAPRDASVQLERACSPDTTGYWNSKMILFRVAGNLRFTADLREYLMLHRSAFNGYHWIAARKAAYWVVSMYFIPN